MRIQFDTGIDDLVDVNVRFLGGTRWGSRQRTRAIVSASAAFAVGMIIVGTWVMPVASGAAWLGFVGVTGILATGFGFWYRSIYDARLRSQLKSYLEEHLGPDRTWLCEIELRPDGAWTRGQGLEMTFPWSEATAIDDLSDGVLLRFRPGVIFARNRAFATAGERGAYVEFARAAAAGRS